MESENYGKYVMEKDKYNKVAIRAKLEEVMDNSNPNTKLMTEKIEKYSKLLAREEKDGLDLVHWVEYVRKFGIDHLHPLYLEMTFYELYNLDILAALFAVLYLFYRIIHRMFCGCKKTTTEDRMKKHKSD